MITYYELQKNVLAKFNLSIDNLQENKKALSLVKSYINHAQGLVYQYKMPWMPRKGYLTTKPLYSTGTLTATQDSATLTGAGTVWTRDMAGQKIIITDGTDGEQVYRIKSFTDGATLTLETNYIHTGGALLTYKIYYDTYTMPEDFKEMAVIKNIKVLTTYVDYQNYLLSAQVTDGIPTKIMMLGVRTDSYYDTGTITTTNGSNAIVGLGTSWDNTMIGRYIQIDTYGKLYKITAVGSVISITIERNFGDVTATTKKYKIDPPGLFQVRFHGAPSARKIIPYTYWPKAIRLMDNEDISPIPSDSVLEFGGIYLFTPADDQTAMAGTNKASAKKDFDEEVARLTTVQLDETQQSMPPMQGQ
jgi:hypothetical protein